MLNLKLEELIKTSKEPRELKRALAVKMIMSGLKVKEIEGILQVSDSFISKWKLIYEKQGTSGLRLKYQGKKSYLDEKSRKEVISILKQKNNFSVEELRDYLEANYQVIYKSKQSYYELLKEGGLSWKRTEKVNPKRDEAVVLKKHEEIKKLLQDRKTEIESGKLVVFIEDECHLLWGDTIGYVWGKRNKKIQVPIRNEKDRQTYYGAVNYLTGELFLKAYPQGNGIHSVSFVKELLKQQQSTKILLIWDGASYHKYGEMQNYLKEVNAGLEPSSWLVSCILLAPNAPQQNPVEDIWLKGKNFLRRHFYENKTFSQVKQGFFNFLNGQIFDFPKLSLFGS